jgi:BlaI family transcriptional regulator, penicillinase repressor
MPRRTVPVKTLGLTDLQLEIMAVLWRNGSATVTDVHQTVGTRRGLAPATLATLLRRLENKGAVTHSVHGRQFIYRPTITSDAVRRSRLSDVAEKLLPADVPALISQLLTSDKIGAEEIEQVKKLIAEKEREQERKERRK